MPEVVMLIGLPGSGKTTYSKEKWPNHVRVSSDDMIDAIAKNLGKTYNDVFQDYIKEAQKSAFDSFKHLISTDANVVIDRTNMSQKSRAQYLALIPNHYSKVACYVVCSNEDEHQRRLTSREGKVIPDYVLKNMRNSFQDVVPSEGFQQYLKIDTYSENN